MIFVFLTLILGFQLFFLLNLQFTAWPEMLSYPYLRNHGFLIYKDMIHPYSPLLTMGLSWAYSIFGYKLWVLQIITWSLSLLSSLIVWLITRYLTKSNTISILILFFYAMFQPHLDGNMLWFDNVIVLPILLGLFFFLRQNLFLSGLFLSVAALTKQTAGLYLVFVVFYLLFTNWKSLKHIKSFLLGPVILLTPLIFRLIQEDALTDFLNWTVVYPLTEFSKFPGYVHIELSLGQTFVSILLLFPLLLLILRKPKVLNEKSVQVILGFLVISIVTIYPRFSFFHAQTAIAILVILYGVLIRDWKTRKLAFASITPFLLILGFIQLSDFTNVWGKEARFYGNSDIKLAQLIREKTEGKSNFLLGLHSGIYSMANLLPPKRWTDNFGWYLEIPGVQEEVVRRWNENPPDVVLWKTPSQGNWFDLSTYQPVKIVKWIEENYNKDEEIKQGIWLWRKKPVLSE